ncbi:MAG: AMP-binding protein [Promethearchaeia archaeon]
MNLKKFHVDDNKVWFTGGFWPKGVPKQFYKIKGLKIQPLFDLIVDQIEKNHLWDESACLFVIEDYIEKISFKDLINYAKKFGTFLKGLGIGKGDVVAICMPNSVNFVIAYLGILYIGAIAAPANPYYRPSEYLHEFSLTKPKVLVLMDGFYYMGLNTIINNTTIKHLILSNLLDFVKADYNIIEKLKEKFPDIREKISHVNGHHKNYKMDEEINKTDAKEIKVNIDEWNDVAVYLMTGGTTGLPKVAMLSHANLISNLYMLKAWTRLKPGMVNIGTIPLFHSYGMTCIMNTSLTLGMKMLLFPKVPSEKELCEIVNKIDAPEGMIYTGVEVLFKRLTEFVRKMGYREFSKKYDIWKKLTYANQGAGPLREEVRLGFEEIFCPIRVGYGLTETSPVVSIDPYWGLYKPGKIGLPLPGTEWAIFDPDNFEAGPICDGTLKNNKFGKNYPGEICVAGPQVMLGYLNQEELEEQNIKMWNGKRWMLTGDIGYMDKHGFCKIIDRKKSLIKVSGNSVYPKEIENLLKHHNIVEEAVVAGLPDEETGEAVKAWITIKKNININYIIETVKKHGKKKTYDASKLKEWCKQHLVDYKCPKYIEVIRKFPRSPTGAILIDELIEEDLKRIKKGKPIRG